MEELVALSSLVVNGDVIVGEGVRLGAEDVEQTHELHGAVVGTLEEEVLEEMRDAVHAWEFIARPHLVPNLHGYDGLVLDFLGDDLR